MKGKDISRSAMSDGDDDNPRTEEEVRGSLRGTKSHFTRCVNALKSLIPVLENSPTVMVADEVAEELDRMKVRYERTRALYDKLEPLLQRQDQLDDMKKRRDDMEATYNAGRARGFQALAVVRRVQEQQPPPQQGPQQNQRNQVKEATGLRPDKLTLEHSPAEMRSWVRKLESYFNASRFDLLPVQAQQEYLMNCLGGQLELRMREVFTDDMRIAGHNGCVEAVKQAFRDKYPLIVRRQAFFRLQQAKGQKFTDFATELRALGDDADLQHMTAEDIYVYRYINGTCDAALREKFLREEQLTMEGLKTVARAHEMALATEASVAPAKVLQTGQQRDSIKKPVKCFRCGKAGHVMPKCRAKKDSVKCSKCGQQGHATEYCEALTKIRERQGQRRNRSASANSVGSAESEPKPEDSRLARTRSPAPKARVHNVAASAAVTGDVRDTPTFLCVFETGHKKGSRRKRFHCEVLPDTGSARTIMRTDLAVQHDLQLQPSSTVLLAANGSAIGVKGEVTLTAVMGDTRVEMRVVVADIQVEFIMAWYHLQPLGIISSNFPCAKANAVAEGEDFSESRCEALRSQLMEEFATVFSDELEGRALIGDPMKIHIKKNVSVVPRKVFTARQIPLHMRKPAEQLIQKLLSGGIIARVEGPTDWVSPAKFVAKANGGVRLVTDYVQLNKFVERPIHPFPSTQDIIQNIPADANVFAKMDAVHGYFQIPLDEESSKLTTFLLPSGRYRYLRAPMGLNASSDEWCARHPENR